MRKDVNVARMAKELLWAAHLSKAGWMGAI
jgi:hypothetical protein